MVIETPPDIRLVEDYDIEAITGNSLTVTIDPALGDTIDITPSRILIYVAPRQSRSDPTLKSSSETTTINQAHVFAVRKREREVMNLTIEQQVEWSKTFKELGGKVH